MPSPDIGSLRRTVEERTNATIINILETVTQTTGLNGLSTGVGPAVNRRWRIDSIAAAVFFASAPAAGDAGSAIAVILDAAANLDLIGAETTDPLGQTRVTRGMSGPIYMENPQTIRVFVNAIASSVSVTGRAVLMGIEYEEIQ